jgi:hypothetical protein
MKQIIRLKVIFIFGVLLLCGFSTSFGQPETQTNLSKVALSGKATKLGKHEWRVDFSLENKGNNTIYFAANPTEVTGKHSYYISLDENGKSIKFSSRVFPPSLYSPYSNSTHVELKRLNIGDKFSGKIYFNFPLKETIPPVDDPYKTKKIVSKKIKQIELTIGYFNEEAGITDFLKVKPFGWFIVGHETLFSGEFKDKRFFEIQNLVSVNVIL